MALADYFLSPGKGGMTSAQKDQVNSALKSGNTDAFFTYSGLGSTGGSTQSSKATSTGTGKKSGTASKGTTQQAQAPSFDYGAYLKQLQEQAQAARNAAYLLASNQQKANYNLSLGQMDSSIDAALREAYVNQMMSLKSMPQAMSAQGLHGGMSETATANLYGSYQNARNALELERAAQKASLLNTYQNNLAKLESQRMGATTDAIASLVPQMYKYAAKNPQSLYSLLQGSGQAIQRVAGW